VELTFNDEGISVTTVNTGEQAILKLEEVSPDVVLADVHMPGMSGYKLCEQIKRTEHFRYIPVILLVGSFEPFDPTEARKVGADDYLTKPFQSIRNLVNKVTSLLGGAEEKEATTEPLAKQSEAPQAETTNASADFSAAAPSVAPESLAISTADTAPLPATRAEDEDQSAAAPRLPREDSFAEVLSNDEKSIGSSAAAAVVQSRPTTPLINSDTAAISFDSSSRNSAKQISSSTPASSSPIAGEAQMKTTDQKQAATSDVSAMSNDESLLELDAVAPPAAYTQMNDSILDLGAAAPHLIFGGRSQAKASGFGTSLMTEVKREPKSTEFSSFGTSANMSQSRNFSSFDDRSTDFKMENSPASSHMGSGRATSDQITADQLSPEAIELIAHRAVEYLSEKVVQEIAWEVVPQLAELLIKRRLEDEKT
jgi:CheY-like chemotaxis protein